MSEWIPSNPYDVEEQPDTGASVLDVAKSGVSGALDAAAQAASSAQYGAAQAALPNVSGFFRGASELLHTGSEAVQSSETEGGQRAASAKFLPDEGEVSVAEAPVSSAAMKGANLAPYLFLLSAFPESAIGSAMAGGGLQAAQHIDAALAQTNRLSDDELKTQSPVYAGMRETMDENEARAELAKIQVQGKDLLAAGIIGAIGNGAAARALKGAGATSVGVAKTALPSAAEGALGMGAGAAEADYGAQQSQQNIGAGGPVNWHHVAMSGLEAMIEGGIIGGGAGALHGMGGAEAEPAATSVSSGKKPGNEPAPADVALSKQKTTQAAPTKAAADVVAPELGPDATQTAALQAAPAPAPAPAPAAQPLPSEVSAPPAPAPKIPSDVGQNVPEAPATLQAQTDAVQQGRKKAVLYPEGTETPAPPNGMKAVKVKEGVVHFDPKQVKRPDVIAASKTGKLNELLDLGPVSKEEAVARAQQGEQPVAVVERTPEGVEAKTAAGTDVTAPEQVAALEQTKLAPENTVSVEPPEQVLQDRATLPKEEPSEVAPNEQAIAAPPERLPEPAPSAADTVPAGGEVRAPARQPRVLEDVTPKGKKAAEKAVLATNKAISKNIEQMEAGPEEAAPKGKNWTKAQLAAREASATKAKDLFDTHAKEQLHAIHDQPGLNKYQARLQRIMDGAKDITLPSKVGYEGTADHLVWLADVKRVLNKLKQRKGSMQERLMEVNGLILHEAEARDGNFAPLREARKIGGEEGKRGSMSAQKASAVHEAEPAVAKEEIPSETAREVEDKMAEAVDKARVEKVRERPKVDVGNVIENGFVQAGANKAGTFKTEKVRKIVKPVTAEGKKAAANQPAFYTPPKHVTITNAAGHEVTPVETHKIRDLLDSVDYREHGRTLSGNRVAGMFAPLIAKRMKELVGHVDVHIVSPDDMVELTKSARDPQGVNASGYYLGSQDHIVLNAAHIANPIERRHVLLHEAVHAALWHALEKSPHMKRNVRALMDEFLATKPPPMRASEAHDVTQKMRDHYAFQNEHEFLSEALSNPMLSRRLQQFHISDALAKKLGLAEMRERSGWYGRVASGWDALVDMARKALDLPARSHTALEAAMSISERLAMEHPNHEAAMAAPREAEPVFMRRPKGVDKVADDLKDRMKYGAAGAARYVLDKMATLGMLSRNARELFGSSDPMRRVYELRRAEAVEKQQILEKHGGAELVNHVAALERKYSKQDPAAWDKAMEIGYDATLHDIDLFGDNAHFGKDKKLYWQASNMAPQLKAEMRLLPADLQDMLHDSAKFFRDEQNRISLGHIKDLLKQAGVDEPGLAERIHADGLTDEDKARFESNEMVKQIDKARELKKINGTYFPLRRYGSHIVAATHDVEAPAGAIKVAPDTVQFTSAGNNAAMEREAKAFVQSTDLRTNGAPKAVWVDKNDPTKIVEGDNVDAIKAIRVKLHNREVHFAEGEIAARRIEGMLKAQEGYQVTGVRLKEDNPFAAHASLMSSDMENIVRRMRNKLAEERAKDNPNELEIAKLNAAIDALYQSTVAMRAGNRIQSTHLPRRNVAGFSKDFTRTLAEYADMSAGYLARLEHRPEVEAALKEAHEFKEAHKYEATENTLRRDELYNEIQKRVYGDDRYEHGPVDTATRRLLQMSMLDKLGGVSYHVINMMEPTMLATPYIGGRHGYANAAGKLVHAYNLIGGRGALLAGIKDTAKALTAEHGFTDYIDAFKKSIAKEDPAHAKQLGELLDRLHDRGLLDKEAEFEVRHIAHPEASVFGRALDKADLIVRQMGVAVESLNRAATGIAAYTAEMQKTGDHQKAMNYAFDVVHDTMGDYSRVNAPPVFNHPVGRLALQFKKYGQKQYYLLGKLMHGAFAGDKEARKQLAGVLFTHAVMAGALGLPLEPIKIGVTTANLLGGTQFTWEDFEQEARRIASDNFGQLGGEVVTRGLPRALGVDLSGRLGQDSLLTHGAPHSAKDSALKEWLFDTIAGAPAAQLVQITHAVRDAVGGDLMGATKAIPIKALHDIIAADKGLVEGKKTSRGYEGMRPYTLPEAAMRALGFKPRSEAENSERRAANYHESVQQKAQQDAYILRWIEAKPADRGKLWGEIERWNAGRPRQSALTRARLDMAARERRTKLLDGDIVNGQQVNKYNRHIIERNKLIYGEF